MAVSVVFYTFSKKLNSTAQPSGGTTYECVLKEPCGVLSPRIALNVKSSPSSLNYAYISEFGRYYYVREWTWVDGLWVADMQVDALASWKTWIGNQFYYCLRASFAGLNTDEQYIVDAMYPMTSLATISDTLIQSPFTSTYSQGRYVVNTMSSAVSSIGGMSTYVLSQAQFNALRGFMFGEPSYMSIEPSEMSAALQKLAFNPGEYILSVKWIGLDNIPSGDATTVAFGWWDSGIEANLMPASGSAGKSGTITIPKHPLASMRGAYLNTSPYSTYTLYAGPFGTISLDSSMLVDATSLVWSITTDLITADSTLRLATDSATIGMFKGKGGIDINLGSIVTDVSTALTNPIGTAVNAVAGAVSSVFSGGSIAEGITQATASAVVGQAGSGNALLSQQWHFVARFADVVSENAFEYGRPYCKTVKPSEHPNNYFLMGENHVTIPATATETEIIGNYLTGGFFYE